MQNNKKIIFNIFASHYLPHVGGIEVFVENFSRELLDLGYKVNIITSDSEKVGFWEKEKKLNLFRLKSIHLLKNRFPVPYSIKEIYLIYKKCFKNKETCTVINTRFFLTSILGIFMGKLSNSKIIVIDHGSGHFVYKNKIMNFMSHFYEHFISFIISLFKPDFYGVSNACCDWLKHFDIKSKGVIYNGISFDKKYSKSKLWNEDWNNKKIIFYAGRLIKEKGILELIKSFDKFSQKNKNYILLIAGSGDLENNVKNNFINSENKFFLGRLDRSDVFYFLSKTKIFVNPSNYPEGLPTVLLEAGSFSIPIISTPNGGAKEIIFDKKTGILIPSGNVKNIYQSLVWINKNHKEAVKMGNNLNKILKQKFEWKVIVKNFILKVN